MMTHDASDDKACRTPVDTAACTCCNTQHSKQHSSSAQQTWPNGTVIDWFGGGLRMFMHFFISISVSRFMAWSFFTVFCLLGSNLLGRAANHDTTRLTIAGSRDRIKL